MCRPLWSVQKAIQDSYWPWVRRRPCEQRDTIWPGIVLLVAPDGNVDHKRQVIIRSRLDKVLSIMERIPLLKDQQAEYALLDQPAQVDVHVKDHSPLDLWHVFDFVFRESLCRILGPGWSQTEEPSQPHCDCRENVVHGNDLNISKAAAELSMRPLSTILTLMRMIKEAFKILINFRTKAIKKEAVYKNNFASEGTVSGQSCKLIKYLKNLF